MLTALDVRRKVLTTSATRNNHKGAKGLSRDVARNTFLVNKSALSFSIKCAIQNSRKATRRRKYKNENRPSKYNVILRRVRVTIVAVNSNKYYIF